MKTRSLFLLFALSVTMALTSAAAAPVANPDSATLQYGQKVRIAVLANDTGTIDSTTVVIVQPPQFGTATPDSSGRILYSHTSGTPTADSFTYQVSGGGTASAPATVTIQFSTQLRLTNNTLNVPSTPPATTYQLSNAFPNLSFSQPLCLVSPPGDTQRLFVLEKIGMLKVITNTAATPATVSAFLNVPALLTSRGESLSTDSEQGLLGLAFHPGYATNGLFYIFYSASTNGAVYERVSQFHVQSDNPNAADPSSELILISQLDPAGNHNGGDLHFGADGYLYFSVGDGGDQNDSLGNAQHINLNFFSAIARIDVDKRPGNLAPNPNAAIPRDGGVARYAIPSDNPFVGATTFDGLAVNTNTLRTEFWAVGFRNPWRFSFDAATGILWCGDVGQDTYEEVDQVTRGGNYGWSYREAKHPGPRSVTAPAGFTSIDPIYEYVHTGVAGGDSNFKGNAIIGGLVYRGLRISSLVGSYIFGDYVSGNIWAMTYTNSKVAINRITGQTGISGFGTDPANGDVLIADVDNGSIYRLMGGSSSTGNYPTNLSDTGVFADVTTLSPSPGVLPYAPNLSFWSDYAVKSRWFVIPDGASQITWARDASWVFPTNMIWVKHFDLDMTRGDASTRKRIETRLIVRNSTGIYGVSYRWNAAQTDAALVPDAGADFNLTITNNGVTETQTYHVPSRAECLACHNAQAGYALSFNTRQLNRTNTINGFAGNQIDLLHTGGYFANTPDPTGTLPYHVGPADSNFPFETRVRSYLAVNCAYCHLPGGSGGGTWDGRATTPLFLANIINGAAVNNGGNAANQIIVPRDTAHSVILNRIAVTNGFTRMPPLDSTELDQTNIALVTQWIQMFDTNRMSFSDWQIQNFGSTNAPAAAPNADPDNDGRTNFREYLTGTSPVVAQTNVFDLAIHMASSNQATINYTLSANAAAQVQSSTNLSDWSLWNAPGNNGLPRASNPQTVQGPTGGNAMFFRLIFNQR